MAKEKLGGGNKEQLSQKEFPTISEKLVHNLEIWDKDLLMKFKDYFHNFYEPTDSIPATQGTINVEDNNSPYRYEVKLFAGDHYKDGNSTVHASGMRVRNTHPELDYDDVRSMSAYLYKYDGGDRDGDVKVIIKVSRLRSEKLTYEKETIPESLHEKEHTIFLVKNHKEIIPSSEEYDKICPSCNFVEYIIGLIPQEIKRRNGRWAEIRKKMNTFYEDLGK